MIVTGSPSFTGLGLADSETFGSGSSSRIVMRALLVFPNSNLLGNPVVLAVIQKRSSSSSLSWLVRIHTSLLVDPAGMRMDDSTCEA